MGLILFPLYILSFTVFVYSCIFVYGNVAEGKFQWYSLIIAFFTFIIIYLIIYIKYKNLNKIYSFDPVFDFPIKLIILPFIVAWILRFFKHDILSIISTGLLISIILSAIAMVSFDQYFLGIIEYLGKEKSY